MSQKYKESFDKVRLKQFRIKNFLSIKDTGFISVNDLNGLVGINGAGKSNILLALWRFNPFHKKYMDYKGMHNFEYDNNQTKDENEFFIECIFSVPLYILYFNKTFPENDLNFEYFRKSIWDDFGDKSIEFIISKNLKGNFKLEFFDKKFKKYENVLKNYDNINKDIETLYLENCNRVQLNERYMLLKIKGFYNYFNKELEKGLYVNKIDSSYTAFKRYYEEATSYFENFEDDVESGKTRICSKCSNKILKWINDMNKIIDLLIIKKIVYENIPKIAYYYTYLNWFGPMDIDENLNYSLVMLIKNIFDFDIIDSKDEKEKEKVLKGFSSYFNNLFGIGKYSFKYENSIYKSHNFLIKQQSEKKWVSLKSQSNGFKWLLSFFANVYMEKKIIRT